MKLSIIDGTGDYSDASYAVGMRQSFCHQLFLQMRQDAQYERGPSMEGYRMEERGARAAKFLRDVKQRNPNAKLYLAGYSRGGSAVIMAAEMLQKDKIDIEAMFLFDPVARHMSSGGEVVPANVKRVWTARRSLDPALMAKYEGSIGRWQNPMRPSFGTTAVEYLGSEIASQTRIFRGSHGALGGVGWTNVAEDPLCQREVAAWMNGAFQQVGLHTRLHAFPPSSTP